MKSIFYLLVMLLGIARIDAGYLALRGDSELNWNVTDPICQFKLRGKLTNYSGIGTGQLKLILWATRVPYPATGMIVGEANLGALGPGQSFTNFTVKTDATLPIGNGDFFFTIAVAEYTTAGWRNQLLVATGTETLQNGEFVDQERWILPPFQAIDPPKKLKNGSTIKLKEKATKKLNKFPLGWRERTKIFIKNKHTLEYSNNTVDLDASYTYKVGKKRYRGHKGKAGKLTAKYSQSINLSYQSKMTLFFRNNKSGTYKDITTSYWLGESFGSTVSWGSFRVYEPKTKKD